MPLTAVLDGRPIFIFDHDAPALATIASQVKRRQQSLRCKDCAHQMTIVMPARRTWHFRHLPSAPTACHFVIARESDTHRELKRRIYDMCRARGWEAEVEWRVPGTSRRADVWTRDHLGRQFTFEVQLSAIPDDTSFERSNDHLRAGLTPVWLVQGDLRSWAFPEGVQRVRLHRQDDWVLTGMGEPVDSGEMQATAESDLFMYARTARSVPFAKLLPLLDAPLPTPSPSYRIVSRTSSAQSTACETPLALPTADAARRRDSGRPSYPLADWARRKRLDRLDRARAKRKQRLLERAVVIETLRSLADSLTEAPDADAIRFRLMADTPASAWTDKQFSAALHDIWSHRMWLRDRGWQPICGVCGLPVDVTFIRSGVHAECRKLTPA